MSPETAQRLSLDQKRAQYAYAQVAAVNEGAAAIKAEYTGVVQNLPVAVLQNGLGQTVAFLMSKAKGNTNTAEGAAIEHLSTWLIDIRRILVPPNPPSGADRLMRALLGSSRDGWARAEDEALAIATWLKRFAEALMPKKI
jgi:CRISPR-associated protein Cmr5